MLLLAAWSAVAHASDVLLVEATPATESDVSVAGLFHGMVVTAAESEGLDFEDPDAIRAWAGTDADVCWASDECPVNLWRRTDARLAVILRVGRTPSGLDVAVRLHGRSEVQTFEESVPAGQEAEVAGRIVRAAREALEAEGGADAPVVAADADGEGAEPEEATSPPRVRAEREILDLDGDDAGDEAPERASGERDREARPEPEPEPRSRAARTPPPEPAFDREADRRSMGIPSGAYARYEASGLGKDAWLARARPRTGRGYLEIGGGWSVGDVDRNYAVRVRVGEEEGGLGTVGDYSWESARAGAGANVGLAVGYAPVWFFDSGVNVTLQLGKKHLDTGWECPAGCDAPSGVRQNDPVTAAQAILEPRFRLYPVPIGVAKPYVLVGMSVFIHDGTQVADTDTIDYPDALFGASAGPTGGLGLAFDTASHASVFFEVPATLLLAGGRPVQEGVVAALPDTPESNGYIVRLVAGMAIRL